MSERFGAYPIRSFFLIFKPTVNNLDCGSIFFVRFRLYVFVK